MQWIREHVDRRTQTIYVHDGMIPYAERYLADYRLVFTGDTGPTGPASALQPGFFLIEGSSNAAHAYNFVWPRERLWKIVRRRYFEVSLQPVTDVVDFGSGWYDQEAVNVGAWRWMAGRGVAYLKPIAGRAVLSMSLYVPLDVLHTPPTITITLNGMRLDRFSEPDSDVSRAWEVTSRSSGPNELIIETDRTVNPAVEHVGHDTRDLGVRLNSLGWTPVR